MHGAHVDAKGAMAFKLTILAVLSQWWACQDLNLGRATPSREV
tara:strand:- start:1301 stop:1429 length:129 start_codon:yes stop_codon:yes gene_type:complete